MFSLHRKVVRLHDGVPIPVSCEPDFSTDPQKVIDTVERTKPSVVILTSPNNPTGKVIPIHDIAMIASGTDGFVVLDEAYHEFIVGKNGMDLLAAHPNIIVLRTFSKAAGLAGLRLGYLVAHPDVAGELLKARLPFMIDGLTEEAARAVLRNFEMVATRVDQMKEGRAFLFEELSALEGVNVVPSEANFMIFATDRPSDVLVSEFARRGILIRDMSGYRQLKGYVRVNCGTEAENHAFLSALNDILFSGRTSVSHTDVARGEKPLKTLRSQSDSA
jgi:histidinol-phosphate aminotransferase